MLKNKNKAFSIFYFILGLILFLPSPSYADCANPAAPAGRIEFTSATGEHVFKYCNGSVWVPWPGEPVVGAAAPNSSGAGADTLDGLSDVNTPAPTDGQCLKYVSASTEWQAGTCGSGGLSADSVLESHLKAVNTATDEYCLTYETTTGDFEWQTCGGASPGAPDRGIQFNSGGAFAADTGLVFSSTGDLMVSGTYTGTASVPASGAGTRMFFDVQKGAFRAGDVSAMQWNNGNIGSYSMAMGADTTASGLGSTAMGASATASGFIATALGATTLASGDYGLALGRDTIASGMHSTAMGWAVTAGDGTAGSGFGDGSMALGLIDDAVTILTRPQVTGIQSFGIFMGDQDGGIALAAANTMGLFGGKMVIDPAVPATNLSADTALEVEGTIKIGSGGEACDAAREGAIQYLAATDTFEVCNTAGSWTALGGGTPAGADREIQFNSGGAFGTTDTFKLMADGDLLLSGTYTGTASVPVTGAGTRVFFDTQKAAFRAGMVSGTQWDNASIGNRSMAMGYNTTASGSYTTAMGSVTTASGQASTAMGFGSIASGQWAEAMGYEATAGGDYSLAVGHKIDVTATGDSSIGFGLTTAYPATAPQVSGAQSFGIFMGNHSGVNFAAANTMGLFGGKMVIDPRVPAANLSADTALEVEGALKIAYDAQSCAAASEGAIRYDSASDTFQVCATAGSWTNMLGGGTPAGADKQVQFNNAGAFGGSANLVFESANGRLGVGTQLPASLPAAVLFVSGGDFAVRGTFTDTASVPASGAGTRMYFDVEKAAFRAGGVSGTQWNNGSEGRYSTALGWSTTASGWYSLAVGEGSTASSTNSIAIGGNVTSSGQDSVALGSWSTSSGWRSAAIGYAPVASGESGIAIGKSVRASGVNSTAFGTTVYAGDGTALSGFGDGSVAFGLSVADMSPPAKVTGDYSFGIFMSNQSGVNFAAANTMGLFGGKMVIDPAVPATNLAADTALEVEGALKIAYDAQSCAAASEGAIRYDSATDAFEVCATAGAWTELGGGGGTPAGADREIQFNSGGAFGTTDTFKLMADGDLLLSGTYTGTASVPVTGAGTRMFFDVQRAAFRAGGVNSTQWDNASIGIYSTAIGNNATASGSYSVALGTGVTASNWGAVALGDTTTASGNQSTASGERSTASGSGSVAMGADVLAANNQSIALGNEVDVTGQQAFGFGLTTGNATDPIVSGNQSLGIFMGNQNAVNFAAANTMGLFGGSLIIDPTTPATKLSTTVALDVVGDINYTGVIVDVSDIRMKYDIKPLDSPLRKLTSLNGFSFKMKGDEKEQVEYGVSAQDVQKAFPELVHQVDDNGTLGVAYDGLIAPMIEAIKEQQAEIEALRLAQRQDDAATRNVDDVFYTGVMLDVADDRVTENKAPIEQSLAKISALHGFSYKRKGDPDRTTEYGLSAQDVQAVFPELVHTVDEDQGTLGVNYMGLLAPMLEAVKELKAENEMLKQRLEALEQQRN